MGRDNRVPGVPGLYLAAFLSLALSVDTSWRYFGEVLGITGAERVVMFAVLEVGLLALGWGMRANMIRYGRPGSPRNLAWALCAMSGYMAWQLSGPAEGLARVLLGPLLALVFLHQALGIEARAHRTLTGTWARVWGELRERALSRIGLGDDTRDALTRTRDRAAERVARLALARTPLRQARLRRAVRVSGVAWDAERRERLLVTLAALRHADELGRLDQLSPWAGDTTTVPERASECVPSAPECASSDTASALPSDTASALERTQPSDIECASSALRVRSSDTAPDDASDAAGVTEHGSERTPERASVSLPSAPSDTPERTRERTSSAPGDTGGRTRKRTSSDADLTLIESIRQHERTRGALSQRGVMAQFQVGSSKAKKLLAAARNGQEHHS
jgi:hypothetical protein